MKDKISLTGDRPTGALHLGHYVGSLRRRTELQHTHQQFIMVADLQGLTSNYDRADFIRNNIHQVVEDYLSVGIDPQENTIFVQSAIPALHEIGWHYMNLVTIARLHRNPTVKQEMLDKGYDESVPMGFFCHPVTQAADITAFKADVVPVGADQKPMIEQTNEIVRKFCDTYNTDCLKEVGALIGNTPRLMGIDGKSKASKSLNNAIYLSDDSQTVREKVFAMYTDPDHIHVKDPGKVEGNMVFHYLDAFYQNTAHLEQLKADYQKGGLGDVELKKLLYSVLEEFFGLIRTRRAEINQEQIVGIIHRGNKIANDLAQHTLQDIRSAMGLYRG